MSANPEVNLKVTAGSLIYCLSCALEKGKEEEVDRQMMHINQFLEKYEADGARHLFCEAYKFLYRNNSKRCDCRLSGKITNLVKKVDWSIEFTFYDQRKTLKIWLDDDMYQWDYMDVRRDYKIHFCTLTQEECWGGHLKNNSADKQRIPITRDQAGWFLCCRNHCTLTKEKRGHLVWLLQNLK